MLTKCIYRIRMILKVNTLLFLKQHSNDYGLYLL
jgi:hypothetical protein